MSTNSGKTKMAALQLLTHHLVVTMREELHKSMCEWNERACISTQMGRGGARRG